MFKTNEYYFEKIIKNIDFILEHMEGISKEQLENDEILSDSMAFRLVQISEIAKNFSEEYKNAHPEIPWTYINALRNRLVHDYGNVDLSVVYDTLTKDLPKLKELLESLLV